jgi:lipopolysaccharide export system protein LptC
MAIGGLALTLGGWIAWGSVMKPQRLVRDNISAIHMINPKFAGRDSQGRSFMLAAKEAARDDSDLKAFILKDPIVTLSADGPRPTRLMAKTGLYREDDRILRLNGDVQLDDGSGYRFASQEALVDTRAGALVGNQALNADGPMGEVKAGSFGVYDKGARTVFRGRVRARLNQH